MNPKDFKAYLDRNLLTKIDVVQDDSKSLKEATKLFMIEMIKGVLKKSRTQTEAALRIGIPFSSFVRTLAKLGINPEFFLKLT